MDDPLVTVGIVSYQHERYIEACLRSVLAQGYRPLEIVVGDDDSPDGTLEVIQAVVRESQVPVRVLPRQPRLGASGNINRVLAECQGDLICIVGGDDILEPGKVAAQVASMADPGVSLAYHDVLVFTDDPTVPTFLYSEQHPPRTGGAEALVRHGTFLCAVSAMFRREAVPAEGLLEQLLAADWLFFTEVARRGRIAYLPDVLARYRQHPASLSRSGLTDADLFHTLDIFEERFPEYRRAARLRRADLHYILSSKAMGAGDRPLARREARRALRLRPFWPPVAQAWLVLASLGIRPASLRPWQGPH